MWWIGDGVRSVSAVSPVQREFLLKERGGNVLGRAAKMKMIFKVDIRVTKFPMPDKNNLSR